MLINSDIYELNCLKINCVELYITKKLIQMIQLNIEEKKIWIKGLVIHCPMGESVKDCPANEIRLLPIPERLRIIDQMSTIDINQIIDHHSECLLRREGRPINWN